MRLPARNIDLPGGLSCPATLVEREVWLAHLVKHPLGLDAIVGRPRATPWNREGWDTVVPPVIEAAERDRLVRNIAALDVDDARCGIPELRGGAGASDLDRLGCYRCPEGLAAQCAWILDSVSAAYAAVTTTLVEGLAVPSSIAVPRTGAIRALTRLFAQRAAWSSLAFLSVGLDARRRAALIARISRADGVRAEFYVSNGELRWRTTWRQPPANSAQAMSFLLDFAPQAGSAPFLSDQCAVDRLWWERHGS